MRQTGDRPPAVGKLDVASSGLITSARFTHPSGSLAIAECGKRFAAQPLRLSARLSGMKIASANSGARRLTVSTSNFSQNLVRAVAACALASAVVALPSVASAASVIKQPGAHPKYDFELEPHFVFQWDNRFGDDDGFGPGVRFNIPFLDNGPISKINNNMAIGVGLDLTFGDNDCGWWWRGRGPWDNRHDCSVTEVWVPVVLQWNFFLTDIISVFGEPGFAFVHRSWDWQWYCDGNGGPICDFDDSDNDLEFVFWGGARFQFSDAIGATVRVGSPYVSVGINILF